MLLRVFTVIETTCKKIWACPLSKIEKNLLSVDVRGLKMLLLEHTNRFERCLSTGSALFAFFGSGFAHIFEQILSIRVNKSSNNYKFCSYLGILKGKRP